ncbi:MAG TPA: hypothetical protein VE995_08605 [Gaiellaceae bacterium]|nr:hypothetical protein [Gaiellaceae bacterium]
MTPVMLGQRPLVCAVGAVLVTVLASGCGGASVAPAFEPPTVRFTSSALSFRHPPAWQAYPFRWRGALHVTPFLYLSTQPVHDPCRTRDTATVCAWPLRRLRPGGVLVVWEDRGWPGWSLARETGTATRVGGRPATRLVARPGPCGAIGGTLTVALAIASPLPDTWTQVTACLRRPGLAASERALDAVLDSTRFGPG